MRGKRGRRRSPVLSSPARPSAATHVGSALRRRASEATAPRPAAPRLYSCDWSGISGKKRLFHQLSPWGPGGPVSGQTPLSLRAGAAGLASPGGEQRRGLDAWLLHAACRAKPDACHQPVPGRQLTQTPPRRLPGECPGVGAGGFTSKPAAPPPEDGLSVPMCQPWSDYRCGNLAQPHSSANKLANCHK